MKSTVKISLPLVLLTLFISFQGYAQTNPIPPNDEPHIKIYLEKDMDASAEEVWEILGNQFGNISQWASTVDKSVPVNREEVPKKYNPPSNAPALARKVNSGKKEGMEVLTYFSDDDYTLEFQTAVDGSGPLIFSITSQKVRPIGKNKSKVIFEVKMYLKGALKLMKGKVKKSIEKNLSSVLQELKAYAETGDILKK